MLAKTYRHTLPTLAPAALILALATPRTAQGEDDLERGLREPIRLTVGDSNQLMGVVGPKEERLVYLSDQTGTLDLFVQEPVQGGPKAMSDGLGDVAWPQVSPDGTKVAYISYERDATGDVCVRKATGGDESCISQPDEAALQVLWWDASSVAVLSRRSLHGDFALRRVSLSGGVKGTILERNMIGVALSPNHRWLAYIPLGRRQTGVGVTFSNRTGLGIELQRVGQPNKPRSYRPNLPGTTGYLAFSAKGDFLYFSQYLNDTNRDGRIDGDDHSVLFRVAVDNAKGIAPNASPEQLTSARWDCHYPAPGATFLVATCSQNGSLDIYRLPLDGLVPPSWSDERVVAELNVARDNWSRLLLHARRLALGKSDKTDVGILREMLVIHLRQREFASALHYAKTIAAKGGATGKWAKVMTILTSHRQADLALVRGRPTRQYLAAETARRKKVAALRQEAKGDLLALLHLVTAEIQEDIGDKTGALASFEAVLVSDVRDPLLLTLYADFAERLYAVRGDRDALLSVYAGLSNNGRLPISERLRYAEAFVHELLRGLPRTSHASTLASRRAGIDDDSELALLLDAETAFLELSDATQEDVRKILFAMYKKNRDPDRRRALSLAIVRRAAKLGNEYLLYQFANTWASGLRYQAPERKFAEALYRTVMMERAYGEQAQGEIAAARGSFYGTTLNARSLEGHEGFIEARLAEGIGDLDKVYEKRFKKDPDSPEYAFVKAYRLGRTLPEIRDVSRHNDAVEKVIALLTKANERLPRKQEIHQLWGYALHQRSRRTGSRDDAVAANRQYRLSLELAKDNPRMTASLLHQLAIVNASLGNHRIALRYYQQRGRLPHVRPLGELGFCVGMATSAWHTGEARLAVQQMERALTLVQTHKDLSRFRPLVLDRLGMSSLAAGDFEKSLRAYRDLQKALRRAPKSEQTAHNHLVLRIGLGTAALKAKNYKEAISVLEQGREFLAEETSKTIELKNAVNRSLLHSYRYEPEQYRALLRGLLAQAYRQDGNLAAAEAALKKRHTILAARYDRLGLEEDLQLLAQVDYQLGELAYRQKNWVSAKEHLEAGLIRADKYNRITGSKVTEVSLHLLRAYAEVHLYGKVPRTAYQFDLVKRLEEAFSFICRFPSAQWRGERFLFELYLTMLRLPTKTTGKGTNG